MNKEVTCIQSADLTKERIKYGVGELVLNFDVLRGNTIAQR